ncbi:hypothetical protein QNM99_10250, partial [Pseudomonas sp. PCH446]
MKDSIARAHCACISDAAALLIHWITCSSPQPPSRADARQQYIALHFRREEHRSLDELRGAAEQAPIHRLA